MLGLTVIVLLGIFYVTGRCFIGRKSVLVLDFGIVHGEEALKGADVFPTEASLVMPSSGVAIEDHPDGVNGVRRSLGQLYEFVRLQGQSRSFRYWKGLHSRFDDRISELALEVVNVAIVEFWQFTRRIYLTMRRFRVRQNSNYKHARHDRGVAGPLIYYRKTNFQRLIYMEGVRCSNQSNVSDDKLRPELQGKSVALNFGLTTNDAQLSVSSDSVSSADNSERDADHKLPHHWRIPAFAVGVLLFILGNFLTDYGAKFSEDCRIVGGRWHKYGWLYLGGFTVLAGLILMISIVPFVL
jgi:hypothetical protein